MKHSYFLLDGSRLWRIIRLDGNNSVADSHRAVEVFYRREWNISNGALELLGPGR